MLTAVLGSLTVLHAYVLGARAWSRAAGLLAALFLATSPFHMRHSQFVTTDVPSAWVALVSFAASVLVLKRGRWQDYVLAGIFAGLAASTKYPAGLAVLPLITAHGLRWRRRWLGEGGRVAVAGAGAMLGFVMGTPYAVLDWPRFLQDLRSQAVHYAAGAHGDAVGAWNLRAYLEFFWEDGLRPAGCIGLIVGLIALARRRPDVALVWLSFCVPYLLLLLSWPTHFMRNLLPVIAVCSLPIGVGGAVILEYVRGRVPRLTPVAAAGVLLAFYGIPARDAVIFTRYEAMPDSKVLAGEIVRRLPRGRRIAVELNPQQWAGDPIVEPVEPITARSLDWYRANGYRYLVANGDWRSASDAGAYQVLRASATVAHVLPGNEAGRPGPRIEVLDLGSRLETLSFVRRPAHFEGGLSLQGYEAWPGPLRSAISALDGADERLLASGDGLQLNLIWQTAQQLPHDYMLFVHVLDGAGQVVAQRDTLIRASEYPTSRWQVGEIVLDRADMPLPALPPGSYSVVIGVYQLETMQRLRLSPPEPGADSIVLTTIEVR